jgi:hypothetical protein
MMLHSDLRGLLFASNYLEEQPVRIEDDVLSKCMSLC